MPRLHFACNCDSKSSGVVFVEIHRLLVAFLSIGKLTGNCESGAASADSSRALRAHFHAVLCQNAFSIVALRLLPILGFFLRHRSPACGQLEVNSLLSSSPTPDP